MPAQRSWRLVRSSGPRVALGALIAVGIAVSALLLRERVTVSGLERLVEDLGAWGPAAFMGLYLLAPALLLPGTPLTVAAGALFGPVRGTFYSLLGATAGATVAFLIARYLASDWAERKAHGRLARIKQGVEADGWKFVALVRLVPLLPFNLLNYALGLTRIGVGTFAITSFVTMLPGAAAYAYLGHAGLMAAAGSEGAVHKALLALGLLAVVVALPWLLRRLRGPAAGVEPERDGDR
jgi:uncharacterized membrane protein YdjX (TVP38/TMEM64 family)